MPKGSIEEQRIATAAVSVRQRIRDLEIGVASVRNSGQRVMDLLKLRDELEEEMDRLQREEGVDLRPERTRVKTVDNILMRKASEVDHELRSSGGLAGARRQVNPPEERWWWYLDLYAAERQRKKIIRGGTFVVSVLVVLLVGNYLLTRFAGGTPAEREARGYTSQGEQYMGRGDYDKAIVEYEKAVAVNPKQSDAEVILAVLYEVQGQTEKSKAAFAAAEGLYPTRTGYLIAVAWAYQNVNRLDQALSNVNQAIALTPESAQAFLIRGGIYEAMNKLPEAMADYQQCASLAEQQKQDAIYVLAKTRLAMLMQRGPSLSSPGAGF